MLRYSRSDLCPHDFVTADGSSRRLGIVSSDVEMSVEMWESPSVATAGNESYRGGRGKIKGTVVTVLDLDAQAYKSLDQGNVMPRLLPGKRGYLNCFLRGAAFPNIVQRLKPMPKPGDKNSGIDPAALALELGRVTAKEALDHGDLLGLPVRIARMRFAWMLEKAIMWGFDVVGDFEDDSGQPRFVIFPVVKPVDVVVIEIVKE